MGFSENDKQQAVQQDTWTTIPLGNDGRTNIQVSNPAFIIPDGLKVVHGFVDDEECRQIIGDIDKNESWWEGFEQRRRVQRYQLAEGDAVPSSFNALARRVAKCTGLSPQTIVVEEYSKGQLLESFSVSKTTVTTFECFNRCSCPSESCSCFVATVPICAPVVEFVNRPKRRYADCWELRSPKHKTELVLPHASLFVKADEALWDWRTRICATLPNTSKKDRFVLVKFLCLPETAQGSAADTEFRRGPSNRDMVVRSVDMPPLEEMLTIVVTTSPIRSNPSTELLEKVFETFLHGGSDFALKCRKVIVCDGYRHQDGKVSKRHQNSKQAMRNGIVDTEQRESYELFKQALRVICDSASEESPFFNTMVAELEERQGYGFALRHALQRCVHTPFVIVIQHDRTFMRPTPIFETVKTMWYHSKIKYVGISMRSNLLYRDHFLGKYGKTYMDDMASCILRPPELSLGSELYGPGSASTENMTYKSPVLRDNIMALRETYQTSQQNLDHLIWLKSNPSPPGKCQLSLTPTFFWYDNVHICETEHYRDFIFDPLYRMVVRGGFVEDKLSPVIKKTVERLGLVKGHERFGCYLLDDHSGFFFTGHLDGGTYMTKEQKEKLPTASRTKANRG